MIIYINFAFLMLFNTVAGKYKSNSMAWYIFLDPAIL